MASEKVNTKGKKRSTINLNYPPKYLHPLLAQENSENNAICEPPIVYGRRPRSSILEMFVPIQPELFELEEVAKVSRTTNAFGEEIIKVDGEIPLDLEPKNGDRFLFISYDQSVLTHGLHKYPAKFFPELPRWLIKKYSKEGDWVLDPFTGSATVNLESLLARRNSVGIDVDPFSKFLARVKLTPLKIDALRQAHSWLKERIVYYKSNIPSESEFPDFPYRDNWFNKYIIEELSFLKKTILELRQVPLLKLQRLEVQQITNFFLICFSSIIRGVSNADDNCTRTVIRKKLNKQINKGDALYKFAKAIDVNVQKMIMFANACPRDVKVEIPDGNDARDIEYPDNFFHLAVTSPPYVNAVDYPRTHQLEMYWLGLED